MHARTVAAFEMLEKADWFTSLGKPHNGAARVLPSWDEAIAHCRTIEWENFVLEGINQYRETLCTREPARFNRWNDLVNEVRPITLDLVHAKCKELVTSGKFPKNFDLIVFGDIVCACMEAEYADVWPPGYFASLAYWYINGHFPCGWQGPQRVEKWNPEQEDWVWHGENPNLYPAGFYDKIATWYETGFGDWQGQVPEGKLIVY